MSLMIVFAVTFGVFVLVITGMAVGVMLGRREISGSCGGLAGGADLDGQTSCSLCSDPDAACRELGRQMQSDSQPDESESVERSSSTSPCQKDCVAEGCDKETIDACNDR